MANKSQYEDDDFTKDIMDTFLSYKLANLSGSKGIYSKFNKYILRDEFNPTEFDEDGVNEFMKFIQNKVSDRSINVLTKIFNPEEVLFSESENTMFDIIASIEHAFQHYVHHLENDHDLTVGYHKSTSSINLFESKIPIHAGKIKPMLYRTSGALTNTNAESSFSWYLKKQHSLTVNGRQKRSSSKFKDFSYELNSQFPFLTDLENCIPSENALVAQSRQSKQFIDKEFYGTKLRNKKINYIFPKAAESKRFEINVANFAIAHTMNAAIPIAHKSYFSQNPWHVPVLNEIFEFYSNMKILLPEKYRIGENSGLALCEAVDNGFLKRDRSVQWKITSNNHIEMYDSPLETKLADRDYVINPDGSTSIIRVFQDNKNFVIAGPQKVTHVDDNLDVYCSTHNKKIGNLNCFIQFAKDMYKQMPTADTKRIVQGLNYMKTAHKGLRKLSVNESF